MPVAWWLLVVALAAQSPSPQPGAPSSAHPGLERIVAETDAQRAEWATRLTRMVRVGALRLREQRTASPSQRDQWYIQMHKGVPVEGGEVWSRTDGATLVAAEGTIYRDITADPVPKLTRREILDAIAALEPGTLGPSRPPDLVVLPTAEGGYALAYRARVFSGTTLTTYYLDAATGAVVLKQAAASMPPPASR
jgi:hypothetical protein